MDVLEARLRSEVDHAGPGQRLRVDGVARALLEQLAQRLHDDPEFSAETYLVDSTGGPEAWRVGVHKVVRRRDQAPGVVVALVPPDVRLAAGDSIDVSTFRAVATEALAAEVERALLASISPALVPLVHQVTEDLVQRGRPPTTSARLAFLATIASQERQEPYVVGGALFALGLVPDFDLFVDPSQLHYRIGQRNLKWAVEPLRDLGRTPIERVMRLPLTDGAVRERLLRLFDHVEPERVEEWGLLVATDPQWRSLGLERWPFEVTTPPGTVTIDLEMLKLPARDDGILVLGAREKLRVVWRTSPPGNDVPGLRHFRVEVVRSDQVVAWESPLINVTTAARRSKELKDLDLDPDVYFVRVVGLTETGDPFVDQALRDPDEPGGKRTNESDDFIVIDQSEPVEDVSPVTVTTVGSFAEAELLARWAAAMSKKDPSTVAAPDRAWLVSIDEAVEAAIATLRFETQRQFTLRVSQRLRRIEAEILASPELDGARDIELGHQSTSSASRGEPLPLGLATSRQRVFEAIRSTEVTDGSGVVALADLDSFSEAIEDYAREYEAWVSGGHVEALSLDVVRVTIPGAGQFALMSPTHPLRLLWLLQEQALERAWTQEAAMRTAVSGDLVGTWRRAVSAMGIPPLIVLTPGEYYVDAGPLPGGWGSFISPRLGDSRAAVALLRRRLGAGAAHASEADISPRLLADRLEMFVQQHAYTQALVLNVINPGDGSLLVDALEILESRLSSAAGLRYDIRLFSEGDDPTAVGQAFRDLMDPERQLSEAAARLAGPGISFLFPKLSWSRKSMAAFLADPDDFKAHITMVLDHFRTKLSVAAVDKTDRSSFVNGLIQESPQRFMGHGSSFRWIRRSAPMPCPELPGAEGRSARLASLLDHMARTQAGILTGGRSNSDYVAVTELDLDPSAQSLLYSAHAISTWVLTLDANLGLDYFDARGRLERPGYLLDFTPEFSPSSGRQLLLTTRADEEIVRLVSPLLDQLGLDPDGPGARLIIESLRALSGRLALRLASSPSQRQGALGMALAKLFLESFGLLEESVVIPLDAHPELSKRASPGQSPDLRSDLLIVSADPSRRVLGLLIVEAKCFAGAGLGSDLRQRIDAQTMSSVAGLRDAFEALEPDDRIDRQVQSWKLTTVLSFYLDRAIRYGLVDQNAAAHLRTFFQSLDQGYELTFRRAGLVFRHETPTTYCDREDADLPIWIVGRDVIDQIVTEGLEAFITTPAPEDTPGEAPAETPTAHARRTLTTHPTWPEVRRDLRGPSPTPPARGRPEPESEPGMPSAGAEAPEAAAPSPSEAAGELEPSAQLPNGANESLPVVGAMPAEVSQTSGPWEEINAAELADEEPPSAEPQVDVLIGENHLTPQYGVLGVVAAEPFKRVGLDLNGCNTVSVFGVQGGGKSYTLGSVLEMAVLPIPGINRLPGRLGAVVFHYHQTQDYPPEFVSMVEANNDSVDVASLATYGGSPAGVEDLVVLTTSDTVERRQAEFRNIQVEPIKFGSSELTVADWRFLMGATGNDSLYLKLLNGVMQDARHNLTLDSIRQGLAGAPMSDGQRALATTRLDLASRFIDDSRSLRSILHPGRIVVVDLRDEFIERDEALGLFVTMLNVFAGAGMGDEPFNKIIVFDEAHKYMGGSLIGQVVEVIREMRHKGVSVVIASQDPVNVPAPVVELSSAVVLHRFNSPNWLKHIQRSLAALGDLTPAMLSSLAIGEAFVWANRATDPVFTRRAVKVRMRPRVTKHGGSTRKAVD